MAEGVDLSNKVIAIWGERSAVGSPLVTKAWYRLSRTASAGDCAIVVDGDVSAWPSGALIDVGPTEFPSPLETTETETVTLTATPPSFAALPEDVRDHFRLIVEAVVLEDEHKKLGVSPSSIASCRSLWWLWTWSDSQGGPVPIRKVVVVLGPGGASVSPKAWGRRTNLEGGGTGVNCWWAN